MSNQGGNYRRGGRGTALYVTMAAAFLIITVITAMALFFTISDITVEGTDRYTSQQVIDASGIEADDSIFFFNSSAAEISIKNSLPYVESVKVTRKLPGRVEIEITESVPLASFSHEDSYYVIDAKGRILEKTGISGTEGTISLRGIAAHSPKVGENLSLGSGESVRLRYLLGTLKAIVDDGKAADVAWLDISNLSAVTFELNGYRVNIGTADDLDFKFELINRFLKTHPERGSGESVNYDENQRWLYFMG